MHVAREPIFSVTFDEAPSIGLLKSLTAEEMCRSVHYVSPDGKEYHAGEAITRVAQLTRLCWLARLFDLPILSMLREIGYGLLATSRGSIPRFTRS